MITVRYPIFRRGINSSGQTAPVTLGYLRESRYLGTVYREGRADQGFCEPHRSPTSLRHGSRSPQESHGRNGTLRYTCYTC